MDINSIAGTAALMQTAQTQLGISTTMIKMAADQQNQMATMVAQNTLATPQTGTGSGYGFSILA